MGVRIGNSTLAGTSAKLGAYGTIASVGLGDIEKSKTDFISESNRVLKEELALARKIADGKGPIGVNVMVALSNYKELVEESVKNGADFIISGAGLPLFLPEYVQNHDVSLIPVISSGRALSILLSAWRRKYGRKPDAVIVEGPFNGGHLGFTTEQIENPQSCSIEKLFHEAKKIMNEFNYSDVPLIAAEMVSSRADIEKLLRIGYNGVQIGTYFIAADESGMDRRGKEVYVKAKAKDVVVIKSPVGLPVRVLKTPLVERVLSGNREKFSCPYRCLRTCDPRNVPFCIAKALLSSWKGDIENGLFMCGCNVDAITEIYPLEKFFSQLT
jgi:NAD(P)H-dependent flavin oxidoreductase YrpB (nitropropane dioxygenase family)